MARMLDKLAVHVRWMIRRDLAEVLRMESEQFPVAWNEDDFIRCLRQRNCIGMVAESEKVIVGYMIYELHAKHLHLLNIAVDGWHQRRGTGRAMIALLKGKLSAARRTRVLCEVREGNTDAHLFLSRVGFRAVNVLREAYGDSNEDAYQFQYCHKPEAA